MRYSVIAAQDGSVYHDSVEASSQEEAETLARDKLAEAWNMGDILDQARAEGAEDEFDAELDGFAVDPDPEESKLQLYRQLADGLSDMIENGRLVEGDIPDDYRWLVALLVKIVGSDPGLETPMDQIRKHAQDYDDEPAHVPGLNDALAPNEEELLDRAEQKHNAQMLDGCETEDEFNAELRHQTQ